MVCAWGVCVIFLRKIGGFYPPCPPKVFLTKRKRAALTLILPFDLYERDAGQAEAPMTAPEDGDPSLQDRAGRCLSFGQKYLREREGLVPRSTLAAGAGYA